MEYYKKRVKPDFPPVLSAKKQLEIGLRNVRLDESRLMSKRYNFVDLNDL